ncbi:hypothetical protein JNK13_11000 [bacterium]|nr:hypothetical protein [bacterium]
MINKTQTFAWIIFVSFFLMLPQHAWSVEPPPAVSQALDGMHGWLNGFESKSLSAVREQLGEPTNQGTWDVQGKKEPFLEYQIKSTKRQHTLLLYFFNGKVIKSSIQVLSN